MSNVDNFPFLAHDCCFTQGESDDDEVVCVKKRKHFALLSDSDSQSSDGQFPSSLCSLSIFVGICFVLLNRTVMFCCDC